MKKLIAVLLSLMIAAAILPSAAATASEPESTDPQITTKNFPVFIFNKDTAALENFPVYFLDGAEDLPFMDLAWWLELYVQLFNALNSTPDTPITIDLEVMDEGKTVRLTRENGFSMAFDFENGQMIFEDYVGFLQKLGFGYIDLSGFPETKDGLPFLLQRTNDQVRYGDVTVVDLKKYGIPMVARDDLHLVPMQTLCAFFLSEFDIGFYFNGEALFVNAIASMTSPYITLQTNLDYSGILTPELKTRMLAYEGTLEEQMNFLAEEAAKISDEGRAIAEEYKKDRDSSMYLKYADVPKADRSEALVKFGFNELALEMDCFYGLKEAHNISDFRVFFLQSDIGNNLLDPDATKADQAIRDLTQYWFDDGHSTLTSPSYMSRITYSERNLGISNSGRTKAGKAIISIRDQYPDASQPYYEVGDTAYVTFDHFEATMGDKGFIDYYALDGEGNLPSDTLGIIINAHRQITRENSPIKKVVLDLSCNTGGEVSAAYFTLGWFLGEANYSFRDTFTGSQSSHYIRTDVNLDHEFDENDTLAGRGLKLYCLISPRSFSCGNMVPWCFKESGAVTLLGRTSGGGSCVVGYNTTAWGTSFQYSSSKQTSFVKNGSFYDVDRGVEPDFLIDDYAHFYDREALNEFISGLF